MNWSHSELRRRLASNPDLSLETPLGRVRSPRTHETVTGEHVSLSVQEDCAQTLYDYMRIHAPDLYPQFIREYRFGRFRIDLAIPSQLLACEVDGGQWQAGGGKHGSVRDYQKTRQLTMAGYRLLRFTASEVRNDPLGVIEEIREALCTLTTHD